MTGARDCRQVLEVLDSYLCGELLVETNHMVQQHLADCASCARELSRRRDLRQLLKSALATDGDASAVLHRLNQHLERRNPFMSWLGSRSGLAAAALVVAIVGAAYWMRGGLPPAPPASSPRGASAIVPAALDLTAYKDAVTEHVECALTFPKDRAFDPVRVARRLDPKYLGLERAVGLRHGQYDLVDAHTCRYGERVYAHLILRGDGRVASLLVQNTALGRLPPAEERSIPGLSRPVSVARDNTYEADGYQSGTEQVLFVSDLPRSESDPLAASVIPPAVKFLQK